MPASSQGILSPHAQSRPFRNSEPEHALDERTIIGGNEGHQGRDEIIRDQEPRGLPVLHRASLRVGVPVAILAHGQITVRGPVFLPVSKCQRPFVCTGSAIEACESDFVGIVGGGGSAEAPVQIVFGETKTEGSIDDNDIRRLGKLADAVPRNLARAYILLSKTSTFSTDEIALAKTLNVDYRRRVILWSRDELEHFLYEGAKDRLGADWHAVSLRDMADITHRLYFS